MTTRPERQQESQQTTGFMARNRVFTLDELARYLVGGKSLAKYRIRYHVRQKRLKRLANGVYATVPTGVDPETFEADVFLAAMAAFVSRHPLLSRVLALKGGTALNLFDVARLPEMGAQFWTDPSFKKLVVAFTGTLDHALHTYGRERLERVRAVDITAELLPMIGGRAAVDREDLIDRAWQAVAPIVMLDDSEREFVDRLQVGEVRLDMLFPGDSEMRKRLEKWPPLQWKALNARKPRPPRQVGLGEKGKGRG